MDDLISRQDAIDAFKKELTVGESKGNYVTICSAVGYEGARQILESLPSAQQEITEDDVKKWAHKRCLAVIDGALYAEMQRRWSASARRKGKWIATQEWGGRNYSCSCCKFSFMVDTCMLEPMWNFCPNCGSEMKGEEDESAD